MILDEYQERLVLGKVKSRFDNMIDAIENKDHEHKWRAINCIMDILSVLMFLDFLTGTEYIVLCDGLRDKYQGL